MAASNNHTPFDVLNPDILSNLLYFCPARVLASAAQVSISLHTCSLQVCRTWREAVRNHQAREGAKPASWITLTGTIESVFEKMTNLPLIPAGLLLLSPFYVPQDRIKGISHVIPKTAFAVLIVGEDSVFPANGQEISILVMPRCSQYGSTLVAPPRMTLKSDPHSIVKNARDNLTEACTRSDARGALMFMSVTTEYKRITLKASAEVPILGGVCDFTSVLTEGKIVEAEFAAIIFHGALDFEPHYHSYHDAMSVVPHGGHEAVIIAVICLDRWIRREHTLVPPSRAVGFYGSGEIARAANGVAKIVAQHATWTAIRILPNRL